MVSRSPGSMSTTWKVPSTSKWGSSFFRELSASSGFFMAWINAPEISSSVMPCRRIRILRSLIISKSGISHGTVMSGKSFSSQNVRTFSGISIIYIPVLMISPEAPRLLSSFTSSSCCPGCLKPSPVVTARSLPAKFCRMVMSSIMRIQLIELDQPCLPASIFIL